MWLTPKHQCLEGGSCCIISEEFDEVTGDGADMDDNVRNPKQ
jgi:hypothetical protein